MTTNHGRDDHDSVPRWAATAGASSLVQRITDHGRRLFRSPRRRTPVDASNPVHDELDVPLPVRRCVLRDYHVANLARARRASEELVRAGFNTGAVPYGYRAQRVRVAPAGRRPRWRTRLVIEPVEAAVVKMIFMWRGVDRLSSAEIRQRLSRSRYPAPLDSETGQEGVWTGAAVRAILSNPKYTGHQVWGRCRHGRRAPRAHWVWSDVPAHPPLITTEEFAVVNPPTATAPATDTAARHLQRRS